MRGERITPRVLAFVNRSKLAQLFLRVFGRDRDAEGIDLVIGHTIDTTTLDQWLTRARRPVRSNSGIV